MFIRFKHVVAEPLDAVDHGRGGCCVDHRRRSDWETSAFRFRLVGTIDEEAQMMSVVMGNIFEVREAHNGNRAISRVEGEAEKSRFVLKVLQDGGGSCQKW